MSTTYKPPQNLPSGAIVPEVALPTNAAAQITKNPFSFQPPYPLPQTTFGTASTVGFPVTG
jgi:hypothetical protein